MRLREDTVYLRFATARDLLDKGEFLTLIQDVETLCKEPLTTFQDLTIPRAPVTPLAGIDDPRLQAHVGAGYHQTTRFRLAGGERAVSLELNAGLHPYSGVYVVQADIRFRGDFVREAPQAFREFAVEVIHKTQPLTLQANDTDDDAVQNIDMPRLAEMGYGVTIPADANERPGREAARGQYRIAPAWINFLGEDLLELLGTRDALLALPETEVLPLEGGLLIVLADAPWALGDDSFRPAQAALRAATGIDALITRDRRAHSYWKTKQ